MKTLILMALVAVGVVGCSSDKYRGAPSNNYDTELGEGRGPLIESNAAPEYPEGENFLWKNRGITPTTP